MNMDRRNLLTAGLATGLVGSALLSACQSIAQPGAGRDVKLWPDGAPGAQNVNVTFNIVEETERGHSVGRSLAGITEPTVHLYPAPASDTAILVIPGGGFRRVWIDKEGHDICRWLNTQGISTGALTYRIPGEGWEAREDAPMQDAKRALRILAQQTGARRIGVMGFSAGGTIAAAIATRWSEELYTPADEADRLDARPAFMALGYPYLNEPASPGFKSMYRGMTAASPPAFFFLAADDTVVTPANSLNAFRQLGDLKVPAALHVFEQGGHGFALIADKQSTAAQWPQMFAFWMRANRFLA